LEAEKNRVPGQAGFGRSNAYIDGVISRNVLRIRANHNGDHKRLPIDGIAGNDQDRPASGLFTSFRGIEVNEVDFASFNHSPSRSVFLNSLLILFVSARIEGSAAIAAIASSNRARL